MFNQALALHQSGKLNEAITIYRDIIANNQSDFNSIRLLGLALRDLGQFDEALHSIQQAINISPYHPQLWLDLASLPENVRPDSEIHLFMAAAVRATSSRQLLNIAYLVFHKNVYHDNVLEICEKIFTFDVDLDVELNTRGLRLTVLLQLGRLQTVLEDINIIISYPDIDLQILTNAAYALSKLGQFEQAEGVFYNIFKRDSNYSYAVIIYNKMINVRNQVNEALEMQRQGCIAEAIDAYRDIITKNADNFNSCRLLGLALTENDRADDASFYFQQAAKILPHHPQPWLDMAALPESARHDSERNLLMKAASLTNEPRGILDIATTLFHRRAYHSDVLELCTKFSSFSVDRALDHRMRALRLTVFLQLHLYQNVHQDVDVLVEQPNTDVHTLISAAYALGQTGQLERADALYKTIISRDPNNLYARRHYADLLILLGRFEEAIEMFNGFSYHKVLDTIDELVGDACPLEDSVIYNGLGGIMGHTVVDSLLARTLYPNKHLVFLLVKGFNVDMRDKNSNGGNIEVFNMATNGCIVIDQPEHIKNMLPYIVPHAVIERNGRIYMFGEGYHFSRVKLFKSRLLEASNRDASQNTKVNDPASHSFLKKLPWLDRLRSIFPPSSHLLGSGKPQVLENIRHQEELDAATRGGTMRCDKLPIRYKLSDEQRERGRALQRRLGIPDTARIVVVHIREGTITIREPRRDSNPETYRPLLRYLLRDGFHVIRIGDRGMTPLKDMGPGFFDMPFHRDYDPIVEPYFTEKCEFFIGTVSGPRELPQAMGRPVMLTNTTIYEHHLTSVFTLLFFKGVCDATTNRRISYHELLADRNNVDSQLTNIYYEPMLPEELLLMGREMVALINRYGSDALADAEIGRGFMPTIDQLLYHKISVEAASHPGLYAHLKDQYIGLSSPKAVLSNEFAFLHPDFLISPNQAAKHS